jgi:hypothetical protein
MDKEFEDWAEEYSKSWVNSKSYKTISNIGSNQPLNQALFSIYIQYKSQEKIAKLTRWLVFGTWALAIGTLLVLILK